MTEASTGQPRPDISPQFVAQTRSAIFADTALKGRQELLRFSKFSERKGSLFPGAHEFKTLPGQTQRLIRRSIASCALEQIQTSIVQTAKSGVFDANAVYEGTAKLLEGTSARNPFPEPDEPTTQISIAEWQKLVKIATEDPTLMRLFGIGLPDLPHSMRAYFRRIGSFLFYIQHEHIPEIQERMEREGVPRTYRRRKFKRIDIQPEIPVGWEEQVEKRFQHPRGEPPKRRKVHFRHRRSNIWQA